MTLVDLAVLAVIASAALRGARRGGTGLVLRAAAAAAGVLVLGALARAYDPDSTPLAVGAVLVGALLGWSVGRGVAARLARRVRGGTGRPAVADRALGVVAHGALALVVCVAVAAVVVAVGPAPLADAAGRSGVLALGRDGVAAAGERLAAVGAPLPAGTGS